MQAMHGCMVVENFGGNLLQQYCNEGQLMSGQRVRVEAGEQHFCVMQIKLVATRPF